MKKIFSLLLICILLTACGNKYETITTDTALELIDKGAIVIDVRTNVEYAEGHLNGAINIPVDEIDTINYDKDEKIIVYCASGIRSQTAINELAKMGYTSLYNLDGGLLNWGGELVE